MKLSEIVQRAPVPAPWDEGDRHAMTVQAYTNKDYGRLLAECGFEAATSSTHCPGLPKTLSMSFWR